MLRVPPPPSALQLVAGLLFCLAACAPTGSQAPLLSPSIRSEPQQASPPPPVFTGQPTPLEASTTPVQLKQWEHALPLQSVLRAAVIDREGDIVMAPKLTVATVMAGQRLEKGLVLLKLKRDGTLRWSKLLSPLSEVFVRAIEVTGSGGYVIAGTFAAKLTIDGSSIHSEGDRDAFVASFTQDGRLRWMHGLGGTAREQATSLAISDDGRQITVGGWAESSFHFAKQVFPARGTAHDGFIATFTSDGSALWAKRYRGIGVDEVRALAYHHDELTVLGSFTTALDFGDAVRRSKGGSDIFCARYDGDSELLWSRSWGSKERDSAIDLGITETGSAYAVAITEGTLQLGQQLWTSSNSKDLLLWRLSAHGDVETSRRIGSGDNEWATDIEYGSSFLLAGYYNGSARLGSYPLEAAAKEKAFLLRADSNFRVLGAESLDLDRLLLVKERFGSRLLVGLKQGRVKILFQPN